MVVFSPKVFKIIALTFLITGLFSCSVFQGMATPTVTPIVNLPPQAQVETVYLRGRVTNIAPFLEGGAYQIQDETGSIWVITSETLPPKGNEVILEGQLQFESIPLAGQDMGELYVREIKKLDRNAVTFPTSTPTATVTPTIPPTPTPTITPSTKPTPSKPNIPFLPHKENPKP